MMLMNDQQADYAMVFSSMIVIISVLICSIIEIRHQSCLTMLDMTDSAVAALCKMHSIWSALQTV